jgi:hypothetical protein
MKEINSHYVHRHNVLSRLRGGVTYKDGVYGLDNGFIPCLHGLQYLITIYSMALSLDLNYSLYSAIAIANSLSAVLYTHIESSWSSGTSFQWRMFQFLGSQTIPATATATLN